MDNFEYQGHEAGFAQALKEFLGRDNLKKEQASFILEYIQYHCDDARCSVSKVRSEKSDRGLDWRVNQLFIDIPNALLVTTAAAMDALWSRGAAMALLAAPGRDLRAWAKLEPTNGMFCNFVTIEEKNEKGGIGPETIPERTSGKPCLHPEIGCNYDFGGGCRITSDAISRNLTDLSERRTIELDDMGYAVKAR